MKLVRLISVLFCLLFCVVLSSEESLEDGARIENEVKQREEPVESARSHYKLPQLFNFERFKTSFKRKYGSILEEMARRKFYLARALQVFLSAVGYKHFVRSYYLAINSFSDWTPAELKKRYLNADYVLKILGTSWEQEMGERANVKENETTDEDILPVVDEEEIKANLEFVAKNAGREPGFKEIIEELNQSETKAQRRKREISNDEPNKRRDLKMDDLFREPKKSKESSAVTRIPSNNPNYVTPELTSYGAEESTWKGYIGEDMAQRIIELPGVSFLANVFRQVSSNFLGAPDAPEKKTSNPSAQHRLQTKKYRPKPLQFNPMQVPNPHRQQQQQRVPPLPQGLYIQGRQAPPQQVGLQSLIDRQLQQRDPKVETTDQQPIYRRVFSNPFIVGPSPVRVPQPTIRITPVQPTPVIKKPLPDEVFIDHRESSCFLEPRHQGPCGSCYAQATLALYEWTFCKQTGAKVAFSEQYVVDCGHHVELNGCDGGVFTQVAIFVDKFGLELRSNYPYKMVKDQCPYEAEHEIDPASMGYLRIDPNNNNFMQVPETLIERYLRERPMVVNIATDDSFDFYGGGVHLMTDCKPENMHSMLLVGSGREDGQLYWILRNSFGIEWGLNGYMKYAKDSTCMSPKLGYMLIAVFDKQSTRNINDKYNKEKFKRRFSNFMKTEIESTETETETEPSEKKTKLDQ